MFITITQYYLSSAHWQVEPSFFWESAAYPSYVWVKSYQVIEGYQWTHRFEYFPFLSLLYGLILCHLTFSIVDII
jgi:hypothetical protein